MDYEFIYPQIKLSSFIFSVKLEISWNLITDSNFCQYTTPK